MLYVASDTGVEPRDATQKIPELVPIHASLPVRLVTLVKSVALTPDTTNDVSTAPEYVTRPITLFDVDAIVPPAITSLHATMTLSPERLSVSAPSSMVVPGTVHAPGDTALGSVTVDVSEPRYGSYVTRLTGVAADDNVAPVPTRNTVIPVAGTLFVGVDVGVGVVVAVAWAVNVGVADGDGVEELVGGGVPPVLPDGDGVCVGLKDGDGVFVGVNDAVGVYVGVVDAEGVVEGVTLGVLAVGARAIPR